MYDDVLCHRRAENTNCLLFWSYEMTAKRAQRSLWPFTAPPAEQFQFTTIRVCVYAVLLYSFFYGNSNARLTITRLRNVHRHAASL